jgi:hypothetical protein
MTIGFYAGIGHIFHYLNQPLQGRLDLSKLPPAIVKKIYTGCNFAHISISRLVCKRWRDRLDSDRIKTCLWHPMVFKAYVRNIEHGLSQVTEKDLPLSTMKTLRNSFLLFEKKLGKTHDLVIIKLLLNNEVHAKIEFRPILARIKG